MRYIRSDSKLEKMLKSVPEDCLDEISNYIDYLLYKRGIKVNECEEDIVDCFGSLSLTVDPLEFQRSVRGEW